MAVLQKLAQNTNANSKTNGKWNAYSAFIGTVGIEKIAEVFQRNCSMRRSDMNAAPEHPPK